MQHPPRTNQVNRKGKIKGKLGLSEEKKKKTKASSNLIFDSVLGWAEAYCHQSWGGESPKKKTWPRGY